jgi:hypothetical protein
MASKRPLTPERRDEVFEALRHYAPTYGARMLHWTKHTDELVGPVASGTASYEQVAMFVIRLAGVVGDLRARFRAPVTLSGSNEFTAEMRAELTDAINALHAQLTEDELLWLELRRHEQCHPALDGYAPDVSMANDWNSRVSKMLGRTISLDETYRRCAELEGAAGGGALQAQAIAARMSIHISNVHLRMMPLIAGLPDY